MTAVAKHQKSYYTQYIISFDAASYAKLYKASNCKIYALNAPQKYGEQP